MGTGGDLAKGGRRGLSIRCGIERDHVTAIGHLDLRVVSVSFDPSRLMHNEKFRVQRSTEQVKRKFSNFWANRKHDEESKEEVRIYSRREDVSASRSVTQYTLSG